MNYILHQAEGLRKTRHHKTIWFRIVSVLAAIVVFFTSYALILPAITKEQKLICDIKEHTHDTTCYPDPQIQFICTPLHEHTSACFDENGHTICLKADYVIHTHSELCFDKNGVCICTLEEYPQKSTETTATTETTSVTFVNEEAAEFSSTQAIGTTDTTPNDAVMTTTSTQTTVTSAVTTTLPVFLHTHGESCYDSNGLLICETIEITEHIHDESCLTTVQVLDLLCGKEEHVHVDACYASEADESDEPIEGTLMTTVDGETQAVISVSGLLPENAELQVSETTVQTDELQVLAAYDIEIYDELGAQYDPAGETLSVSIDASSLSVPSENLTVYYVPDDGGTPEPMNTYVKDGVLCFDTTHFSKYVVVENPPVKIEVSSPAMSNDNTITCTETSCWYSQYTVLTAYKIAVNAPWGTHWGNESMEVTVTSTLFNGAKGIKVYRVSDDPGWNTAIETTCSVSGNTVSFQTMPQECAQYFFAIVCSEQGEGGDSEGGGSGDDSSGDPVVGNAASAQELLALLNQSSSETTITLTNDIRYTATSSSVLKVNRKVNIDLNGHTITCENSSSPLFQIGSNGNLTICDSKAIDEQKAFTTIDPLKTTAGSTTVNPDGSVTLTYYVTDSELDEDSANGATIETVYKHTVTSAGAIKADTQPVFQVNGGKLNIESGMIYGGTGRAIVNNGYNKSTVTLSGGYICGFTYAANASNNDRNQYGGAIYMNTGALTITDKAVIAANHNGLSGGAIALINGTLDITGGVISGNTSSRETWDSGSSATGHNTGICGGGGGVFADSSRITMSGGYVTNNQHLATGYWAGGGGIWTQGSAEFTIDGGYITGNTSAGGGGFRTEDGCTVRFNMYGGKICSNYSIEAEGGGVSLGFGAIGLVTGGYINNNRTDNQIDWGGGGLFCANDAYLYIKNALITENDAGGYGGGVAGCSTARITIAINEGCAIFDNLADGESLSGEGSTKNEDWIYAHESAVFTEYGYQDYFCALNSLVSGGMLGGYPANWRGSSDGVPVISSSNDDMIRSQYIMGLTAHPTEQGKQAAQSTTVEKDGVFINNNYSATHGGGVLCNGYMLIGTPEEIHVGARLSLVAHKVYLGEKGEELELENGQFTFQITDAETGAVVAKATNDEHGNVQFVERIPFSEEGVYTYYIEEVNNGDPHVVYDTTRYRMIVTVSEQIVRDTTLEGLIAGVEKYQYFVDNIRVDKEIKGEWITVIRDLDPDDSDIYTIEVDIGSESFMNMHKHEKTSISVQKQWAGGNAAPVTFYLLRNTTAISRIELSNQKGWEYTWYDLPSFDENGDAYHYVVSEEIPEGYINDLKYENQIDIISNWAPADSLDLGHKYILLSPDRKQALSISQGDWAFSHTDVLAVSPNADGTVNGSEALEPCIVIAEASGDKVLLKVKNMRSWLETSETNGNQGWDAGQPVNYFKTTAGEQYASGFVLENGLLVSDKNRFLVYIDDDKDGKKEFTSVSMDQYYTYRNDAVRLYTHKITDIDHSENVTVTNTPEELVDYELDVLKVSGLDTTVPLENAVFRLLDENGQPIHFIKTSLTSASYMACSSDEEGAVIDLVTDRYGRLALKGLSAGDYCLKEIQAPAGYLLAVDREISLGGSATSVEIVVVDYPAGSYILPETGGNGLYGYFIAGFLLMLVSAFILFKYKHAFRRKEDTFS